MGMIDHFIRQYVQGGLEPGESIMAVALLRHPTHFSIARVPQRYENFYGVATDRRLIVLETDVSELVGVSCKAVARNPRSWWYDELAGVEVGGVEGLIIHSGGAGKTITLMPHPNCGPLAEALPPDQPQWEIARRYDVFARIDGIDEQITFMNQVPGWLQDGVRSGRFAMSPQKRAHVEQQIALRRQQHADKQRARAAAQADFMKKLPGTLLRVAVYGVAAVLLLGGLAVAANGMKELDRDSERLDEAQFRVDLTEKDLAWTKAGGMPPNDCPEKTRDDIFWGGDFCHGCELVTDGRNPRPGVKKVVFQGGERWCPSVADIEAGLGVHRDSLAFDEGQVQEDVTTIVAGAVAALLGLAGALAFLLRDLKKKKQQQPPGSPAPAAPAA